MWERAPPAFLFHVSRQRELRVTGRSALLLGMCVSLLLNHKQQDLGF